MKSAGKILLFFLSLFFISLPLHAEVNSWVDENGVRHYSDSGSDKPPGKAESGKGAKVRKAAPAKSWDYKEWSKKRKRKEAAEKAEKRRGKKRKQAAEMQQKTTEALVSLKKIDSMISGEIDWTKYKARLNKAKSKLESLPPGTGRTRKAKLLKEACSCYEMVLELRRLELRGQKVRLIKKLKEINRKYGTDAMNYYKGRRVCWQGAADKIRAFESRGK